MPASLAIRPASTAQTSPPSYQAVTAVLAASDAANRRPASASRHVAVRPSPPRSRHQALRGNLRLLRRRAIATPSRPLNHLKPTDAAPFRDVQLDVHFAVCNHTDTSLIRGQPCTLLSCSARGDQLSAYN